MIEIRITGDTLAGVYDQMRQYLQAAATFPASPQTPVNPPEPPAGNAFMPSGGFAPITPEPQNAAQSYQPPESITPVQQNPMTFPGALAQPPVGVPVAAPAYTQNDLMTAGAKLMTAVGMPALQELMKRFGVQAIHQLLPEHYGAFAQALREMGAQI